MPKTILIATCEADIAIIEPVEKLLRKRSFRIVRYLSDDVGTGQSPFSMRVEAGTLAISYAGDPLPVDEIAAAWFRKPHFFGPIPPAQDKTLSLYLDEQRHILLDTLWRLIPERVWLNAPPLMQQADNKLLQLERAHSLGFAVPRTIVANNWQDIRDYLRTDEVIFKMPYGLFYKQDKAHTIYTTVVKNTADALPLHTLPFPGIWQEYIPKKREWRVTVVGEQVLAAAIYTGAKSRDDWRKHQHTADVTFKAEPFPKTLGKKCKEYVKTYGLRYGAFDFIEAHDGNFFFLEMNPNGQYSWLEGDIGLPIAAAIADELTAVAEGR